MDDLLKLIDGFVKEAQKNAPKIKREGRWKHCIALYKLGWRATKSEKSLINKSNLIITWEKEGKENIKIELTFADICLWLDFIENKKGIENGNK